MKLKFRPLFQIALIVTATVLGLVLLVALFVQPRTIVVLYFDNSAPPPPDTTIVISGVEYEGVVELYYEGCTDSVQSSLGTILLAALGCDCSRCPGCDSYSTVLEAPFVSDEDSKRNWVAFMQVKSDSLFAGLRCFPDSLSSKTEERILWRAGIESIADSICPGRIVQRLKKLT